MDSNELDLFGQLPSVSKTSSPSASLKSTGPKFQSLKMSEASQQMHLEELTSSVVDRHVSRGPLQGIKEAQKMTAISGQRWLPLLQSYGLNSQLSKTCEALLTSQWASPGHSLIWSASDISRSLFLSLRLRLERGTDAIDVGLWPTMTGSAQNVGSVTSESRERAEGACLADTARMWPTPTTRDYKGANSDKHLAKDRGHHDQLPNAVKMAGYTAGSLNPTWVEWLMGFPTGWTDLNALETPLSRPLSNKSAEQSLKDTDK